MDKGEKYKITFNWKNISTVFVILLIAVVAFIAISNQSQEETKTMQLEEVINNDEINSVIGGDEQVENGELQIEDLTVGEGEEAQSGDIVAVHYRGTLVDGTQFDSSYDRGEPFEFELGAGRVIQGWDEGLVGMKVGGQRKLTIPSSMGYGEFGAPPDIPPNATLVFEVELLEIK